MNGLDQTAKHVNDPWASRVPVVDQEWTALKGAERKYGVMVTKDQHLRIAAT